MSSHGSSSNISNVVQSTPRSSRSPEIIYITTTYKTGLSPQGLLRFRAREARLSRQERHARHAQHIDPRLHTPDDQASSPRALRAIRRNNNEGEPRRSASRSPRVQREIERIAAYQLDQQTKKDMRRIISVIQSKRRSEFRLLREALGEIVNYNGPYLQAPGEKESAAHIIREGGLGGEFVQLFDSEAKWAWLQIRVDHL